MWLKILILLVILSTSKAQNWQTGDNSSVKACSSTCKMTVSDSDRSCWQNSLNFFEESLIVQLRNYISAQIDFDQWHRRHGKPHGQDYDALKSQIRSQFQSQMVNDNSEVLVWSYIQSVSDSISDRIQTIATSSMDKVPLFQCPVPCAEKQQTMQMTFGLSAALNVLLALAVIPSLVRSIRPDQEENEQQGLVNEGFDN